MRSGAVVDKMLRVNVRVELRQYEETAALEMTLCVCKPTESLALLVEEPQEGPSQPLPGSSEQR